MRLIRISGSVSIRLRQFPSKAETICNNPTPNCVRLFFSVFKEVISISRILSAKIFCKMLKERLEDIVRAENL